MNALLTPIAAAPDGTIYVTDGALHVVRINATARPGTAVQNGPKHHIGTHPAGLALTSGGGLLISSDHIVYRLADPEHA